MEYSPPVSRFDRMILDWRNVHDEKGRWADRWSYTPAVYPLIHPTADEVLYLGKAGGCTVRSRWSADDKPDRVWRRSKTSLGYSSTASS